MLDLLIAIIVICLIFAIIYAVVKYFGVPIPQIVFTVAGYILAAVLLIALLRFLWPMLQIG